MKFRFYCVLTIAILLASCGNNSSRKQDKISDDDIEYTFVQSVNMSFSDEGILFSKENVMYFCDGESGTLTAICSDPSCKHKDSNCTARSEGGTVGGIYIIDNKLYYFEKRINEDFRSNFLVCAEKDGSGKKTIGEFSGESVIQTAVNDKKILSIYINSANEQSEQSDKQTVGIVMTDISSGKSEILIEKTADYATVDNMYYNGDEVYYAYTVVNDLESKDIVTQICRLNCETGEDDVITELKRVDVFGGFNDKEILYTDFSEDEKKLFLYDYKNEPVEIAESATGIASYFYIDDNIVFCGDSNGESAFFVYDGQKTERIETKVNQEELPIIYAVTDNYVYVGCYDSEENFCIGRLSHDDFINGYFDKTKILFNQNNL